MTVSIATSPVFAAVAETGVACAYSSYSGNDLPVANMRDEP